MTSGYRLGLARCNIVSDYSNFSVQRQKNQRGSCSPSSFQWNKSTVVKAHLSIDVKLHLQITKSKTCLSKSQHIRFKSDLVFLNAAFWHRYKVYNQRSRGKRGKKTDKIHSNTVFICIDVLLSLTSEFIQATPSICALWSQSSSFSNPRRTLLFYHGEKIQ